MSSLPIKKKRMREKRTMTVACLHLSNLRALLTTRGGMGEVIFIGVVLGLHTEALHFPSPSFGAKSHLNKTYAICYQ